MCTNYEIDWTAIAAIATLLAVLVSLYPIWEERRNRKFISVSLRGRALLKLFLLRDSLNMMADDLAVKNKLSEAELEAIRTLEVIMANPTGLDPAEQESIMISISLLDELNAASQSNAPAGEIRKKAESTSNHLKMVIEFLTSKQHRLSQYSN